MKEPSLVFVIDDDACGSRFSSAWKTSLPSWSSAAREPVESLALMCRWRSHPQHHERTLRAAKASLSPWWCWVASPGHRLLRKSTSIV